MRKVTKVLAKGAILALMVSGFAATTQGVGEEKASAGAMPVYCGDAKSSTWGWGQVCWQGTAWWTYSRDIKTDGYCVEVRTLSAGRWVTVPGSKACSSSTVTSDTQNSNYLPRDNVRLYRQDGQYLTIYVK